MKVKSESEVAQSCPTLSDPMDCSPPGSSVHGIFQARVLEWGAIAFSEWIRQAVPTSLVHVLLPSPAPAWLPCLPILCNFRFSGASVLAPNDNPFHCNPDSLALALMCQPTVHGDSIFTQLQTSNRNTLFLILWPGSIIAKPTHHIRPSWILTCYWLGSNFLSVLFGQLATFLRKQSLHYQLIPLLSLTEISDSLLHHILVPRRTHKSLHNIMPTKWNVSLPFQFSSVAQLCLTLCDSMDCSTPGFPVNHQLMEAAQTHVLLVGDAIQLSHLLPSPSPPAFNLS